MCKFPELHVIAGHICRQCTNLVHALCATELETVLDNARNLICFKCSPPSNIATLHAAEIELPPTAAVTEGSKTSKRGVAATKKPKKNLFQLRNDPKKVDPLLMRPVAFNVNDNGYGSKLAQHFCKKESFLSSLYESRYLRGTIVRLCTSTNNKTLYDFQWEYLAVGDTAIELGVLIAAMELGQKIKPQKKLCDSERSVTRIPTAGSFCGRRT